MDSQQRAALRASARVDLDEAAGTLRAGAEAADRVEPPAVSEAIRWILLAAAEQCDRARHILGLPITHQLALARALLDSGEHHDPSP